MVARSLVKITVPLGLRNPVGHIHDVERRLLELQAAVDLRIAQRAAHGGVGDHAAGGDEVAAEILQQAEIHAAVHAQIERVLLFRQHAPGDA